MRKKIAIEPTLSDVKAYLSEEGYDVVSMSPGQHTLGSMDSYDAIVVSGVNTNVFGMSDTETKAVVINADGLTPPQVARRLSQL